MVEWLTGSPCTKYLHGSIWSAALPRPRQKFLWSERIWHSGESSIIIILTMLDERMLVFSWMMQEFYVVINSFFLINLRSSNDPLENVKYSKFLPFESFKRDDFLTRTSETRKISVQQEYNSSFHLYNIPHIFLLVPCSPHPLCGMNKYPQV